MNCQKHLFQKILLFLIALLGCGGCASVYVPSARNVPLFNKRGQAQLQTSFGNGINANVAYAITNHIAISAGGLYANNKLLMKSEWRVHQSAEGALGFYGTKDRVSFEFFGGYGAGKGHGEEVISGWIFCCSYREQAKAEYKKYFIQPSMGFTFKRIQFIGSFRLSRVDFQNVEIGPIGGYLENIAKKSLTFLEPAASVRYFPVRVYPPLFIFSQAGFNIISGYDESPGFRYSMLHYQLGVGLKLGKR